MHNLYEDICIPELDISYQTRK